MLYLLYLHSFIGGRICLYIEEVSFVSFGRYLTSAHASAVHCRFLWHSKGLQPERSATVHTSADASVSIRSKWECVRASCNFYFFQWVPSYSSKCLMPPNVDRCIRRWNTASWWHLRTHLSTCRQGIRAVPNVFKVTSIFSLGVDFDD